MGIFRSIADRAVSRPRLREKGDAARDARDWAAAAAFYAQYLEREPSDAAIWVQLGHARKESGDPAAAEQAYLRALSLEPGNPDTHVQLGHVEKVMGNFNDAVAHYRKALEFDPAFPPALEELAKHDFSAGTQPGTGLVRAAPAKTLADLDKRLGLLSDQLSSVKAIAFEVQKLRRRMEELDQQMARQGERLADLAARSESSRSEIDKRVSVLESRSPAVQGGFSALLEHYGAIAACREELERQAALIDRLVQRAPRA
jgi:tetratricopeptide (TPR) repeat protein